MKKARAMYIPAGGKKAVWGPVDQNVLPEGYPYKEQSETVVLAEETVTPSALGERYMGALSVVPSLEVGKEYVVYFDGVRYTATAFEHSYGQGSPVIMLTDTGTATSNNWDVQVMGSYAGVMTNSPDAYTFSIYEMTETIHPMAPEFLPAGVGGGAFIVNVTMDENDNYVADKTYAEISEALVNGQMPYCICGTGVFHLINSNALASTYANVAASHAFVCVNFSKLHGIVISADDSILYRDIGTIQFATT